MPSIPLDSWAPDPQPEALNYGRGMEEYVERKDEGLYVAGTRISLDSVVAEFQRGASPEGILRSFPLLGSLERVYGAITYYLAHQQEVDAYLADGRAAAESERATQVLPQGMKARIEQVGKDLTSRSR